MRVILAVTFVRLPPIFAKAPIKLENLVVPRRKLNQPDYPRNAQNTLQSARRPDARIHELNPKILMNRFASTPLRLPCRSTDGLRSPVHNWRRSAILAWALLTLLASLPGEAPAAEPARSGGLWGRYIFTNRQSPATSKKSVPNTSATTVSKADNKSGDNKSGTPTIATGVPAGRSATTQPGSTGLQQRDTTATTAPKAAPTQILSNSSSRRVPIPGAAESSVLKSGADKSAAVESSVLKSGADKTAAVESSVLKSRADKSVEPDLAAQPGSHPQAVGPAKATPVAPDYGVAGSRQAERQAALFSELLVPFVPSTSSNTATPEPRDTPQSDSDTEGPRELPTSNVARVDTPPAASSESSRRAGRIPFQLQKRLVADTQPSAPIESVGEAVTVSRVTEVDSDITTRRTLPLNRKLVPNRILATTEPETVSPPSILLNTATASEPASESAVGMLPESTSGALPLFQDFAAAMASSAPAPSILGTDVPAGKTHLTLRRDLDERRRPRTYLKQEPRTIAPVTHEYQDEPGTLELGPQALQPPSTASQGEPLVPPTKAQGGPAGAAAEPIPTGERQLTEEDRRLWQQIEDYGRLRTIDDISLNIAPFSHRHFDEQSEVQELIQDPTMPGNPAALLMSNQKTIHYVSGPPRNPINAGALLSLADFCHRPLYFQEINLERYGTYHRFWQPALSAAHFFAVLPTLPYQMAIQRPNMCYHYYHPYQAGRPAPWERELPPLRLDASLLEAGVVMGIIILFP
jgi:hypothetical protein